jgi:hypothetical protein
MRLPGDSLVIGTTTKSQAEHALMDALEEWATSLGEHGVTKENGTHYFPSRQITQMRRAHDDGQLIEYLTDWLPKYRGLRTRPGDQEYANRMRDIVEHHRPIWEQIVAARDEPWTPFVTDEQRRVLLRVAEDVDGEIARGQRLRAKLMEPKDR